MPLRYISPMRFLFTAVLVGLIYCGAWSSSVSATVFRDRATFNNASQNLSTIDFESVRPDFDQQPEINGVFFRSLSGPARIISSGGSKMLLASTVGEITSLYVFLPPGTTAVGVDQFGSPMIVTTSTGESVTMEQSDSSRFVGFTTQQPMEYVRIFFDFPEPTFDAIIDNLSFGQRRAANEPPAPQILVTNNTGRTLVLDSVTNELEPFSVATSHNLSSDGRRRLTFIVVGVAALTDADKPFVTVQAEDAQHPPVNLPCEATTRVGTYSWMSQVTVSLPDALLPGDWNVSVTVRGVKSNLVPLHIQ